MDKYRHGDQDRENGNDNVGRIEEQRAMDLSASSDAIWNFNSRSKYAMTGHYLQYGPLPASQAFTKDRSTRWRRRGSASFGTLFSLLAILFWVNPASAALLNFENCLRNDYRNANPPELQFVPKYLSAVFNPTDPAHNLNVTVWGNVTGTGPDHHLVAPLSNDTTYWEGNQSNFGGKIAMQPDPLNPYVTTLFNKVNVLTYQPWEEATSFCGRLINSTCPVSPVFSENA